MKKCSQLSLLITVCLFNIHCFSQTPDSIKILFIYGSKPAKGHKEEIKWFGGLHGGHVGLEIGKDQVINFSPKYYYWYIANIRINRHRILPIPFWKNSIFSEKTEYETWETFPNTVSIDSLKRRLIVIPISPQQKKQLDKLASKYINHAPYDYAFLGMRCASATYDILTKIGVINREGGLTWLKFFTPSALRKKLMQEATTNHWPSILLSPGSKSRVWETD